MSGVEPSASHFECELHEQPDALARLLAVGRPGALALGDRIRRYRPRFVVIAARGSSDNAARYASYLFGVRHGLVTALASPSLVTRYDSALRLDETLVFGVSQSGRSPDIVATVEHSRRQGALTVAATNDVNSPLAAVAEACFPLEAGEERAVAASKTYSNELLSFAMLSAAIADDATAWDELSRIPDAARQTIRANATTADRARAFLDAHGFVAVGRGFNLSTAHEVALKMMEMSHMLTQAFALPDFLHGPVALLDHRVPILVIATQGVVLADVIDFFGVVRQRKAPLIAISDRADVLSLADVPLPVIGDVPEWLSPLTAILPGQLWALGLTRARGLSPDSPRGLSKVTETH